MQSSAWAALAPTFYGWVDTVMQAVSSHGWLILGLVLILYYIEQEFVRPWLNGVGPSIPLARGASQPEADAKYEEARRMAMERRMQEYEEAKQEFKKKEEDKKRRQREDTERKFQDVFPDGQRLGAEGDPSSGQPRPPPRPLAPQSNPLNGFGGGSGFRSARPVRRRGG